MRGTQPIRALLTGRCQHGLPAEFIVEGATLMHSQTLCHAPGPRERIPSVVCRVAAGFEVRVVERSPLGVRHAVTQAGRAAGELVGLAALDGPVWLEIGTGRAPALDAIVALVRSDYAEVLGPPGGGGS